MVNFPLKDHGPLDDEVMIEKGNGFTKDHYTNTIIISYTKHSLIILKT